MSKRLTRVLSLILTLVMFLSVSTPAFAIGGGDMGKDFGRDIGEDEIRDFEPEGEIAEVEELDYFQTFDEDSNVQVTVEAPMGALPTLAELRVEPVEVEDVLDLLRDEDGEVPEVLMAMDISFWLNGIEIEPEEPVRVKITADEFTDRNDLNVIHIPDKTEPESLPLLEDDDLSFALGTNEVAFAVDSFSTFVVTCNRTVTVHYGYMENGVFKDLGSSSSTNFPSSGIQNTSYGYGNEYAYLVYDFEGYRYKETRRGTETGNLMWPVLGMSNLNAYNYPRYTNDGSSWSSLENNSHVYVIYEPVTVTTGAGGSGGEGGGSQTDIPDLPAYKDVISNGDGTFDITLSVTGVQETQTTVKRANVIVIFDLSGSMNDDMDGNGDYSGTVATINSEARLSIAGNAVKALADKLLTKMGGPNHDQPLVQMALITFSSDAEVKKFGENEEPYTTDLSAYKSMVNGLSAEGGTNWEAALIEANALEVSTDTPTYVVFVSDGEPTFRVSRLSESDASITYSTQGYDYQYYGQTYHGLDWGLMSKGYFGTGFTSPDGHYNAAKNVAQSIVEHSKNFYTIGVSTSANEKMSDLATDAYATSGGLDDDDVHYFSGNSTKELTDAFDKIASYVEKGLGFSDVTINDGVTELTSVETDALVGTAGNFVYRKGSNQTNPTENPIWTGDDVPEAQLTADNHVIWNTESIGVLENGVTYSVTFTVWPSQESYDIIADINNGIIRDASGNVIRTTTPEEAYAAQPEKVRSQIGIVNGKYTLLTNTEVNISYKYNTIDDSKEVTTRTPGSMPLDTTYFAMTKEWQNDLPEDTRTANVFTKKDTDGKSYLTDENLEWILDGENKIEADWSNFESWKDKAVFYVELIVTKGGEKYTEVTLISANRYNEEDGTGNHAWSWDHMFVAPGVLTYDKTLTEGSFELRETGDDYTVKEKPSESYYWELRAETYHPMVINGEACVLQLVTDDTEKTNSGVSGETNKNKFKGEYFNINGEVYKKLGTASDAKILAVNERRSYLNLTKTVTGTENDSYDADTYFTYKVKLENPNGLYYGVNGYTSRNDDFWFSIYDSDDKIVKDSTLVTDAEAESGDTGYWHFANVSGGKEVTIKIKAGWNVRFINLLSGTTYEIDEPVASMLDGYVFKSVAGTAEQNQTAVSEYAPTIDGTKINGSIAAANTDYTVTYTNEYQGFFYVYHSRDNTIERYPMAVNGVPYSENKTFNIAGLTKAGSLYGGYYHDYGQKGSFVIAEITSFPYEDETGTPYAGAVGTWTLDLAYTDSGLTMIPESNTVYYLKEVPETKYLQPYMHYTYKIGEGDIADGWLISDVDDLNYQETGFIIKAENEAKVCQSLSVTNSKNGNTVKLTAKRVFTAEGFLTYLAVIKDYAPITDTGFAANCTVLEYWVTPDGLIVTGIMQRDFGAIDSYNTIASAAKDTKIPMTINVFVDSEGGLPVEP